MHLSAVKAKPKEAKQQAVSKLRDNVHRFEHAYMLRVEHPRNVFLKLFREQHPGDMYARARACGPC